MIRHFGTMFDPLGRGSVQKCTSQTCPQDSLGIAATLAIARAFFPEACHSQSFAAAWLGSTIEAWAASGGLLQAPPGSVVRCSRLDHARVVVVSAFYLSHDNLPILAYSDFPKLYLINPERGSARAWPPRKTARARVLVPAPSYHTARIR